MLKTIKTYRNYLLRTAAVLAFALVGLNSYAQEDPIYTQYLNNMCVINPAYTGIPGYLNGTMISRHQWTGFDHNPTTTTLMVNSPIKTYNMGLGGSLIYDSYGPVQQTGFYVDYAYRFRNRRRQYFSFGLKAGVNLHSVDYSRLDRVDPNDPEFWFDFKNKLYPNAGLGFMWHAREFFLGAAVPKLIQHSLTEENEVRSTSMSAESLHAYIMGGYVFFPRRWIQFKPSFLIRYMPDASPTVDLNAQWFLYEELWVGVMYRSFSSFGFNLQYHITEKIKLGYAYDLTTLHRMQYAAGTHEFMVSYDMGFKRRRRFRSPRYF